MAHPVEEGAIKVKKDALFLLGHACIGIQMCNGSLSPAQLFFLQLLVHIHHLKLKWGKQRVWVIGVGFLKK